MYWSAYLSFCIKWKLHENIYTNWQDVKWWYHYWEIAFLIMFFLFPQSSYFFLGTWKKCFYVAQYPIYCEQYEQIQGDRDYTSNSTRKEKSVPGLLHQYIIIPSRSNRIISLPRKKKKYWHKLQAKTRSVLIFWYLHVIWQTPDVCQVLQIIHEVEYVKIHFELYKPYISIHASFFILEISLFCSVWGFFKCW